ALTVIRAFTLEKRENRRFGEYVDTHRVAGLKAGRLQAQFTPLVAVLVVMGTLLVLGVGGYVAAGYSFGLGFFTIPASTIDIGTLILFLNYLKMFYQPMRDLSKLTTLASNASSGAERIQEILDQAPEVLNVNVAYNGPQRLKGNITFENVVFGYIKDRPILKGISHSIPAGRKIALVGYSGSGKTTLVKMIPRFYEIGQGSVKIDGVDVSQYPLHILRQNISLVLQDSILFEGTIRENIEIGRPGATMEQIVDAARKANIHDMITKLPNGYDTAVREQGSNFSGGQRQRLSIARAILRDAPILILDEPTANLDVEAEAEVMHALNSLITGRTVITISHRLSTLGKVDEIIVMSEGHIVEKGTFKELKRLDGVFSKLLKDQNRSNADSDDDEGETLVVRSVHMKAVKTPIRKQEKVAMGSMQESITSQPTAITSTVSNTDIEKQETPVKQQEKVAVPSMRESITSQPTAVTTAVGNTSSADIGKQETHIMQPVPLEKARVAARKPYKVAMRSMQDSITSQSTIVTPSVNDKPPFNDDDSPTSVMTVVSPAITSITSKMTALIPALSREKGPVSHMEPPAGKRTGQPSGARVHIFMNGKFASEYKLEKLSITIGRYSKSDIQIPSSRVSRYHANLYWRDGAWVLEDADSLNGLTWQGCRVNQMALNNGDRIYLDPDIVLQYIEG